jgi:mitochondrial-processing peptidase subunit beta
MGGHLNAYTSREQTAYYAKVFKQDVGKAVDLLADILQNSVLDAGSIERERGVILREAEEVAKQMDEVVFDHLHSVAFQGTALGQTILGPEENIKSISRDDLVNYIQQNYTANRMVLAAAGGVDHDALVKLAESAFSGLPKGSSIWKPSPTSYTGAEVRMTDDSMEHAHMAIAVQGASWTSKDYFPLLVAQAIVGSWNRGLAGGANMASKLAQVVAQNGLAQSFMSFNTAYNDTGLFGIYMVSDHKSDLDDLVYEVQQEWVRLCLGATEAEVARAKTQLKASLLLSMDGTTPVCEDIGRQLLIYGKRYSWPEIYKMIEEIDYKTVRRVASEYLYDRCPAVVALGPIGSFPDYSRIRAATLWLRN